MEVKKTAQADLQNKKSLFGLVGLLISLLLVVWAFSVHTGEVTVNAVGREEVVTEEQMTEITRPEEPPKPEIEKIVAPAATSNVLEAVDNSVDLDDNMDMFDIEATEATVINIQPVEEEGLLDEDVVVMKAEKDPTFLGGGIDKFQAWVMKNVKYPAVAELNNITGRVIVLVVVGRDGFIRDVNILASPDESLSDAVRDVMKKSPKWVPAEQRGKPVSIRIQSVVNFQQISQ